MFPLGPAWILNEICMGEAQQQDVAEEAWGAFIMRPDLIWRVISGEHGISFAFIFFNMSLLDCVDSF